MDRLPSHDGHAAAEPVDLGSRRLTDVPLLVVDVETTGLSPNAGHRVCEIALIRREPDGFERVFASLVDPGRELSAGAFEVNGITAAMLDGAPRFGALINRIDWLLSSAVLVVHNAPFDLRFLVAEYARCGKTLTTGPVIDTLVLARLNGRFLCNSLGAIAGELDVTVTEEHRALADCRTTLAVLFALVSEMFPGGEPRVSDLASLRVPFVPEPAGLDLLPEAMAASIRRDNRLWIMYESAEGETTSREIADITVARAGSRTYLVAHCRLRDAERHFRLDRIVEWRPCAGTDDDGETDNGLPPDTADPYPRFLSLEGRGEKEAHCQPAGRTDADPNESPSPPRREGRGEGQALSRSAQTMNPTQQTSDAKPVIRVLREDEIALLPRLWEESGLDYRPCGRDSLPALMNEWRSNPEGFLGAFVGSRLVASVLAADDRRRGWIHRLAVHPDCRHHGLGGVMIEAAEALLKRRGLRVIAALIERENTPSRHLFEKSGYVLMDDVLYYSKRDSPDA